MGAVARFILVVVALLVLDARHLSSVASESVVETDSLVLSWNGLVATKVELEALRDELAACHEESALAGRSQSRSAGDAVGSEQAVGFRALEVPLAALEAEVTRASARIGLVL
jgi:hypothetical protein